jgi:hypothetical protein
MVMGRTTHPAPIPTANGTTPLSTMFRFLEIMLPAIAATRTYRVPGISFSPDWGGGASDAIVLVKLFSRCRKESIIEFTFVSTAATCA